MNRKLLVKVVSKLPEGHLSRAWGWLCRRRRPKVAVAALKRGFAVGVGIDMSEAASPMSSYPNLEALFVRRLKPGARRVDVNPAVASSPVDGTVGECGRIENGLALQVKGRTYSIERLLGSSEDAVRYAGGTFATFYLAPMDYHRIHAPVGGHVAESVHIPGRLFPVFPEALTMVDGLFAQNERLVTYLDSAAAGRLAVVKVGATLVGRISVSYDPKLHTNGGSKETRRFHYHPPKELRKGEELGAFELGSTVVLLAERDRLELDALQPGAVLKMGQRIGTLATRKKPVSRKSNGTRSQPKRKRANGGRA